VMRLTFILFVFTAITGYNKNCQAQAGLSEAQRAAQTEIIANDMMAQQTGINKDASVKGTPFIINQWAKGELTTTKGVTVSNLNVNVNLTTNELYYQDASGKTLVATQGEVLRVAFIDSLTFPFMPYVFKTGYPVIGKQNENYFYQVLTEGDAELLVKKTKILRSTKNNISGIIANEYENHTPVYYVYFKQQMHSLKPSKKNMLSLFPDKEDLIEKFIETNSINFKKEADLITVFNYYNSLQAE
jgi:hypothetical protein